MSNKHRYRVGVRSGELLVLPHIVVPMHDWSFRPPPAVPRRRLGPHGHLSGPTGPMGLMGPMSQFFEHHGTIINTGTIVWSPPFSKFVCQCTSIIASADLSDLYQFTRDITTSFFFINVLVCFTKDVAASDDLKDLYQLNLAQAARHCEKVAAAHVCQPARNQNPYLEQEI